MTCASGDIRAEEGKIAGKDWKSGQYPKVRSDLAQLNEDKSKTDLC